MGHFFPRLDALYQYVWEVEYWFNYDSIYGQAFNDSYKCSSLTLTRTKPLGSLMLCHELSLNIK